MAVSRTDLSFVKSATVSDSGINGGRMSNIAIQNRVKYNLFPRVTRAEREAGVVRYRKEFLWNKSTSNDTAYGVLLYLIFPSPGNDRFRIAQGTQLDTQANIDSDYLWYGCGALQTAIASSDNHIHITFESTDVAINNGILLAISNTFLTVQVIDTSVLPFQQVYWNGVKWIAQNAPSLDAEDVFPYGTCISQSGGVGTIFSYSSSSVTEYHRIANEFIETAMSPNPDGIETDFAVALDAEYYPLNPGSVSVVYTINSVEYTAYDNGSGNIIGTGITLGGVNYIAGTASITFSTAPDDITSIIFTSAKQQYSWSGNIVTVTLEDSIINNFLTANTFIGMCLETGDLVASYSDVVKTFGIGGTFSESQISCSNKGTIEETWTLLFTSSTAFQCSGLFKGIIGIGSISSSYSPTNIEQSAPYFTIPSAAWGGAFQVGDTLVFKTHPASTPFWWKEIVPAGTSAISNNLSLLEIYVE